MSDDYILGVDVGTSVIKATLFDELGHEIASAAKETILQHPQPTWAELDMDGVWAAVVETIHHVVHQAGEKAKYIRAVGLTGQGDGTWLIDKNHRPVRPAILWLDARAHDITEQFLRDKVNEEVFKITGTIIFPGSMALELNWLQKYEPESLKRACASIRAKDWVFLNMTGVVSTEETDASHTFFDIRKREYSEKVFALLGIENCRHLLPEAPPSFKNIAEILPSIASELGLPSGIAIAAGPFDVIANDVGVGAITPGDGCTILGTAGQHQMVLGEALTKPDNVGFTICHGPAGRYVRVMATMSGTPNLQWFVDEFYKYEKNECSKNGRDFWEFLEEQAAMAPIGSEGIVYHPYNDPAGERTPFVRPSASAQFSGLNFLHRRETMLRAVYEGVILAGLDCYDQLSVKISKILLAGGGAQSRFWGQMLADAVGCQVCVPEGKEFGAKGAAINAGVATGIYASFEEAMEKTSRLAKQYHPNLENTRVFAEILKNYRRTYQAMFPVWDASHQLRKELAKRRISH